MDIKLNDDPGFEIPGDDPMDQNRHCFKKGRHEFMGGPIVYEQGSGYKYKALNPQTYMMEEKTLYNQERKVNGGKFYRIDHEAIKLGVDVDEY